VYDYGDKILQTQRELGLEGDTARWETSKIHRFTPNLKKQRHGNRSISWKWWTRSTQPKTPTHWKSPGTKTSPITRTC